MALVPRWEKVREGWEGRAYAFWSAGPMIGKGPTLWYVACSELTVEHTANSISSWQVRGNAVHTCLLEVGVLGTFWGGLRVFIYQCWEISAAMADYEIIINKIDAYLVSYIFQKIKIKFSLWHHWFPLEKILFQIDFVINFMEYISNILRPVWMVSWNIEA